MDSLKAAAKSKDLGNAAFTDGDYPTAIGHYTAAIFADRLNSTFPLNRAAAYLKLGKNNDAERDCSTVLDLDEKNVKALFRRAQARIGLGTLSDAQQDLERALQLEPANQSVKQELEKVTAQIQNQSIEQTKSAVVEKPKRRRVPIKIVEPTPQKPQEIPKQDSTDLLTPVSSRPIKSPSPTPTLPQSKYTFQEAKQARSTKVGGGIFRASGSHTVFKSPQAESSPSHNTNAQDIPHSKRSTEPQISLFTFTKIWESLATPTEQWDFLVQQDIPPESLPIFLKTSLEPALLTSLLSTFLSSLKSTPQSSISLVRDLMVNLPRVPRFSTILLFMSKEEKAIVDDIWTILDPNLSDVQNRKIWDVVSS